LGAFSNVEAQRTVEVNVVTGTGVAEEFADVVLENVGANSGVTNPDNSELGVGPEGNLEDPTTLFPTSGDSYGDSGYSPDDNDVSLIDNDVQIVYGVSGQELPPNSSVFYDNHFTVVNDSGNTAEDFEVTISTTNRGDLLQQQGNPPTLTRIYVRRNCFMCSLITQQYERVTDEASGSGERHQGGPLGESERRPLSLSA